MKTLLPLRTKAWTAAPAVLCDLILVMNAIFTSWRNTRVVVSTTIANTVKTLNAAVVQVAKSASRVSSAVQVCLEAVHALVLACGGSTDGILADEASAFVIVRAH
jgi:hypothetical protein